MTAVRSTITAKLEDGPRAGGQLDVLPVEGRPPKTIDVDHAADVTYRYCLADWEQSGHVAVYSFLYEV